MPRRARSRSLRGVPRDQKSACLNGLQDEAKAVNTTEIVEEARNVEAILAGRSHTARGEGFSCGMWTTIVLMEVVAFLWLKWAVDIYGIYGAAKP